MPLPGGASEKFGNRYEGSWTVACMIDLMDESAEAIRLEPPGVEGEGVEFWLRKGDTREYHQVKRQQSARGCWTLADLHRVGVLPHFWDKLSESANHCVFVSIQDALPLRELSERARQAASWAEFDREFLKADAQSAACQELCHCWKNCSQAEAYEALKRIRVETISQDLLRTIVENRLKTLVESDPATVADVLAQLALDKVHHELMAYDIWRHLESRDYRRRQWGKDLHVLAASDAVNKRYLSPLRDEAIAKEVIPRDEVQTVLHKLTSPDSKRGVLLSGEAGVGKSGVVLQVAEMLCEEGWPLIAFRVDRLERTQLPDYIGEQLGLPGSPANVLAAIAQGRDCLLIIDQLDAVSLASGRHPSFFECVSEIIKQAQVHPRMHLLLACRKFDLDNDHRLRRLTDQHGIADTVPIDPLSHATVQEVVAKLGLDAERLNTKQLDLLAIPLHLSLLAEITEDCTVDALDFETVKDLYDRFWERKQAVVHERLGYAAKWARIVDALCDYMSDRQVLSAPKIILDEYEKEAEAMASEHVLTRDVNRYSFFHEGFFDYAFARRFAARGRELLPFLRSGEQQLFRRAQVRQILIHERDADRAHYLADLKVLLTCPDIRFHLKRVVFALLAELIDPTEEEWNIIAPLMSKPADTHAQEAWRTLHRSVPWFQLLDSLGLIEQWLADKDDKRIDRAVMLLSDVQKQVPNRVAELIEPHVDASEAWRNRLVYLVQWADLSVERRFFDLFLRLIDEGILDEAKAPIAANSDFWLLIHSLPEERPDWACEVIGHYLNRRLKLSLAAGQSNPFDRNNRAIPDSQFANQIFMKSARGAPVTFVEQVLPFILSVIELTAEREGDPPWRDPVWVYRSYGESHGTDGALLAAMEAALSNLAAKHPQDFAAIAEQLRRSDFETIQYLLIRAHTANGARFADDAADYLCDRPSRLKTGWAGIAHGEGSHWATRELLEAITPYCSDDRLAGLEDIILEYYTDWEKLAQGRHDRGRAQLVLLEAVTPSRRTRGLTRRLEEWRRKFGEQSVEAPKPIEFGLVGSPIPDSAADKMTDEQWLSAIAQYDYEDSRLRSGGHLVGGAQELAKLLESQVKKHPERFAKLVCKFPDDAYPSYFNAVLRGIRDAGLDMQIVLQVCQRCHQAANRPCGRWICDPITKLAEGTLPKEALDIVAWYATEDPDPQRELWRTKAPAGNVYYGGDILMAAINSVRGSAAEAIGKLIFADGDRISYFLSTLERMVDDPSIAVRSCVAVALMAVLKYDRDLAVNLFLRLCETEDILLGTRHVERFLNYGSRTHFEALAPIIERMIRSKVPEVTTVGARQACLASLVMEEARPLAHLCLSGTETQRIGAAQVFAANVRAASFRSFCEDALIQLFDDSHEEVRSEAARCFNGFEGEQLGEYVRLVEAFVESLAFTAKHECLIRALEKTTAKLPDVTCLVCERFLDAAGSDAADIRTHSNLGANTISQLLIRVYSQSTDETLQTRCLDVIDRMTQMGIQWLDEALSFYDR